MNKLLMIAVLCLAIEPVYRGLDYSSEEWMKFTERQAQDREVQAQEYREHKIKMREKRKEFLAEQAVKKEQDRAFVRKVCNALRVEDPHLSDYLCQLQLIEHFPMLEMDLDNIRQGLSPRALELYGK